MVFPVLDGLRDWAPFHIDALGIITLLGMSDVNRCVGTLAESPVDYLPILAGNVIADNSFTDAVPGFVLYNITDGIVASDLAGWFTRWLICQNPSWTSTSIKISIKPVSSRARVRRMDLFRCILGTMAICTLLALAVLTGDWWGVANVSAMFGGTVARALMVRQNRLALDFAAAESEASLESVKVFCTMPSGEAITVYAPRTVIFNCVLTTPVPISKRSYSCLRGLAWLGFGGQVIALGMTTLFNQVLTVVVVLAGTFVLVQRIGTNSNQIGSRLVMERSDHQGKDYRAAAYARLDLSETEEEEMIHWNLLPRPSNQAWWAKYRGCKSSEEAHPFQEWAEMLAEPL